jgi:hypothetical protein
MELSVLIQTLHPCFILLFQNDIKVPWQPTHIFSSVWAATQKLLDILSSGIVFSCRTSFSLCKLYYCHNVAGTLYVSMIQGVENHAGGSRQDHWNHMLHNPWLWAVWAKILTSTHTQQVSEPQIYWWCLLPMWILSPFTIQNLQWYFKVVLPSILQQSRMQSKFWVTRNGSTSYKKPFSLQILTVCNWILQTATDHRTCALLIAHTL